MSTKGNPIIRVRLPQVEIDQWKAAAEAVGLTLSDWVREAVKIKLDRT